MAGRSKTTQSGLPGMRALCRAAWTAESTARRNVSAFSPVPKYDVGRRVTDGSAHIAESSSPLTRALAIPLA